MLPAGRGPPSSDSWKLSGDGSRHRANANTVTLWAFELPAIMWLGRVYVVSSQAQTCSGNIDNHLRLARDLLGRKFGFVDIDLVVIGGEEEISTL